MRRVHVLVFLSEHCQTPPSENCYPDAVLHMLATGVRAVGQGLVFKLVGVAGWNA